MSIIPQRFYVRGLYRVGLAAIFTFFMLNNVLSRLYVRVFEDTLLPIVADGQRAKETSYHARVLHTDSPLCEKMPEDFAVPESNETLAIMLPSGECSSQEKADNVVKYYQTEKSKVEYLLIYDAINVNTIDNKGEDGDSDMTPTMSLFKISGMSGDSQSQIVSLSRLNDKTTKALMELKDKQATALIVNILPDKFTTLPKSSKILCMIVCLAVWIVIIPAISFAVTRRIFKSSLTVEVGWSGIMIAYEGDDDDEHIDPRKLFTKKRVLDLPEVVYGGGFTSQSDSAGDDGSTDVENPAFSNSTCSICIEDFAQGERLRVLPCGHSFHTECIMPWLTTRNANCPMCKESFENDDEGDKKTS